MMIRSLFRFRSAAGCGLFLALAGTVAVGPMAVRPVFAQNTPAPKAPQDPGAATVTTQSAVAGQNSGPGQNAPSPVLPILGCILGLLGVAGAAFAYSQTMALAKRAGKMEKDLDVVSGSINKEQLEAHLVWLLESGSNDNSTSGKTSLRSVVVSIVDDFTSRQIVPQVYSLDTQLQQGTKNLSVTANFVKQIASKTDQVADSVDELRANTAQLDGRLIKLKNGTRENLDAFIFNIYNLIYAELQGEPTPTQLGDQLKRYGRLYEGLHALKGDALTQNTLLQFAEVREKLRPKLQSALGVLQAAKPVVQEKLPYLDESRKAEAAQILDDYRRKIRLETAQAEELVKEISNAVRNFQRPLQTLFAGATFIDVENPARNESHLRLLEEVKGLFFGAGVEIYHPQQGEELDPERAIPEFEFEERRHPGPFQVVKVQKLGMVVDGTIEKGEVIVA